VSNNLSGLFSLEEAPGIISSSVPNTPPRVILQLRELDSDLKLKAVTSGTFAAKLKEWKEGDTGHFMGRLATDKSNPRATGLVLQIAHAKKIGGAS
jgi:hypothetical protein